MKSINYFSILIFIVISYSCEKEEFKGSYLTETSTLNAEINISKTIDHTGNISNFISVTIVDTQGKSLKIKNGWIKVNDMEMNFTSSKLEDGTVRNTYNTDGLIDKVEANKEYSFEIKLSDGTIYNSSIKTQEKDLNELNVPTNHDRNNDMKISWKETHPTDTRQIYLIGYSGDFHLFSTMKYADENELASGEFIIPKESFEDSRLDSVVIKILSIKYGTQDPALYSDVISRFSIEKVCKIN